MKGSRKFLGAVLFAVVLMGMWALLGGDHSAEKGGGVFALKAPPFVNTAHASMPEAIAEQIDEEAGISAYVQTAGSIDLEQIEGAFTTIEIQTTDYIVGSVSVPDYPERYDVHVYADTDGWIMAYYLEVEPVSKIVDVRGRTVGTTLLENTIATVAGLAGESFGTVSYYDFRYPNATNMMFIGEEYNSGDNDFTVELPSSFGYLERSWALRDLGSAEYFRVNGTDQRGSASYWDGGQGFGYIAASDLLPDATHTITIDDFGVLVIVYREQ